MIEFQSCIKLYLGWKRLESNPPELLSPGAGSGPSSSHAPTSGQQFYSRLASGTLGGDEGKSSSGAGYHSLDTATSSAAAGGSSSLNTTATTIM